MFVVTFHSNYILDKPEAREKPQRRFNSAFLTLSSHTSEYFESSQHVADAPSNLKQITVKSLISDSEELRGAVRTGQASIFTSGPEPCRIFKGRLQRLKQDAFLITDITNRVTVTPSLTPLC